MRWKSLLGNAAVMNSPTADQQLAHSLTSLLRIHERLNSTFDLDRLLVALIEQLLQLTNAESGCAGLRTSLAIQRALLEQKLRRRERKLLGTAEYEVKRLHRLMNNHGPMDFNLVTQVLVNLFSNVLKFSPPDKPIQLRSQIVDGNLEVMVVDQGIGIPVGDLERVFQKFHRLAESSSADGFGLGLSICKEFVEAHRERISLEHNPIGGSIARFVLPVEPRAIFDRYQVVSDRE